MSWAPGTQPGAGSGLNIKLDQDPLPRYNPATKQVQAMTPVQQQSFNQSNRDSGLSARDTSQKLFGAAVQAQQDDPTGPQSMQQRTLMAEHPSAFGGLAQSAGRPGYKRPKKPGRIR